MIGITGQLIALIGYDATFALSQDDVGIDGSLLLLTTTPASLRQSV